MKIKQKQISQYVQEINQHYLQLNKKLKNLIISKKLSDIFHQVKNSIQELNSVVFTNKSTQISSNHSNVSSIKLEQDDCQAIHYYNLENQQSQEINEIKKQQQSPHKQTIQFHLPPNKTSQNLLMARVRGPYRQYTEQTKQTVIQLYRKGISFSKISRSFGIPSKNVIRWCRNGSQRKPGAGRKVMDPQMEHQLANWIMDKYPLIRKKAKQLSKCELFYASMGWFKNFMKRYDLKSKYHFC